MAFPFLLAIIFVLYVRPGDLVPSLNGVPFLPILYSLTMVSLGLGWLAKTSKSRWLPHFNWILGTWAAFVFSHIPHTYLQATLDTLTGFLPNVFVVFAVALVLDRDRRLRGFTTLWILLTLFLAVGGIRQYWTGIGWGGQTLIKGRIQGVGIFGDPNDLAQAFLVAVPLVHARFSSRSPLKNLLMYSLFAIFTYATFLTNSRGGILSLLFVFFLLSAHRFGKRLGVVIGALLVGALLLAGPSRMGQVTSNESSAQGRLAAWSEGLQMLKANPIEGVGYGRFLEYNSLTAHNSFVLCVAETGLLGGFFWVGLLYVAFLGLRRARLVKVPDDATLDMIRWSNDATIALIGYLSGAFFLSRTYNIVLYMVVGFAAALYRRATELDPTIQLSISQKDRRLIFGIVVGGVVVTYILVKTLAVWTSQFY